MWLAVGAVAGVALQNKTTPLFLLAAVTVGVLLVGPRAALRSPWPWLGGLLALALWVPNLAWQAANGFPQLALPGRSQRAAPAPASRGTPFLPYQVCW